MRLNKGQLKVIVNAVTSHFDDGTRIYLFGSRLDDTLRGGDIDLFVDLPTVDPEMVQHSCLAVADMQLAIGEQKIDIIIRHPASSDRAIFHEALNHGVLLN
ncbi:MAG: nucleotidyltransferase domain-containing protein [Mariprofundaceae bacterium]